MQSVHSPNVVEVYDAGVSDGKYYILMEDGGDPLTKLNAGNIPLNELGRIYRDLATGLRDLHRQRLHHRDIKPANILIDDKGVLKFTDLGLSYKRARRAIQSKGQAFGTPLWAAPEQFEGEHTSLSDVYSLGLVMYELATGEIPFKKDDNAEKLKSKKKKEQVSVRRLNPNLTKDLAALIDTSILPDPTERPNTEWLYHGLVFLLEDQPIRTMLNEELFVDRNTQVDARSLSRWKEIEIAVPNLTHPSTYSGPYVEAIRDETDVFVVPTGREDYRIAIPNRGAKRRINLDLRLPNPEMEGGVAFTFASGDYVRPTPQTVKAADIYLLRFQPKGQGILSHRRYGKIIDQTAFDFGDSPLEVIIERFPEKSGISVEGAVLFEKEVYTSPTAHQEVWFSSTIPVALDAVKAWYEVAGVMQNTLFPVERSFFEGDFTTAARLAGDIVYDGSLDATTLHAAQMYYAKSRARLALGSKDVNGSVAEVLGILEGIESEGSKRFVIEAGREIANLEFFVLGDQRAALKKLKTMFAYEGNNEEDLGKITSQARRFASCTGNKIMKRAFRLLR